MIQNYINELKKSLRNLKPYKAILFGSYANGTPHRDSDIDLIIVLNKDVMPKSFSERMKNYSAVKKYFYSLRAKVPMDILVYTKAEWNCLVEINNSFYKEIVTSGKTLV